MCTRYYVEMSSELRPYVEAAGRSSLKEKMVRVLGKKFTAEGEIRPTDMTTVIAPSASGRKAAFPMVWGYHIDGIDRPVVNARSESAGYKKSFAADWKSHRCIVPASYYFEWKHDLRPDGKKVRGDKFAIRPAGGHAAWMAGLYRVEEYRGFKYPVFTILTRAPGAELSKIHDRMPLILPASAIDEWIRPGSCPEKIAAQALTDMMAVRANAYETDPWRP